MKYLKRLPHLSIVSEAIFAATENIASEYRHRYIGTEHLLLALVRTPGSLAHDLLIIDGVTPDTVSALLEKVLQSNTESLKKKQFWDAIKFRRFSLYRIIPDFLIFPKHIPTNRLTKVISSAKTIQTRLQHKCLTTQNLLCAILESKGVIAHKLIEELSNDISRLSKKVNHPLFILLTERKECV